jgi:hypothetical protein
MAARMVTRNGRGKKEKMIAGEDGTFTMATGDFDQGALNFFASSTSRANLGELFVQASFHHRSPSLRNREQSRIENRT